MKKSETPSAPLSRGRRSRSDAGDRVSLHPGWAVPDPGRTVLTIQSSASRGRATPLLAPGNVWGQAHRVKPPSDNDLRAQRMAWCSLDARIVARRAMVET